MTVALPPVRYFTQDTPYHYTEDNKPLQDLASRDDALKAAIDANTATTVSNIAVGNWTGLVLSLDLSPFIGLPFALRNRLWVIQDQSIGASQNATLTEDVLMGYMAADGTINIQSTFNNYKRQQGATVLTYSYVPSGTALTITFSGYSGTNGYVISRAERFGP